MRDASGHAEDDDEALLQFGTHWPFDMGVPDPPNA